MAQPTSRALAERSRGIALIVPPYSPHCHAIGHAVEQSKWFKGSAGTWQNHLAISGQRPTPATTRVQYPRAEQEPFLSARMVGLSLVLQALCLVEPRPAAAQVGDRCQPAIAAVHDIQTKVVYTDRSGSIEDEDIKDQNSEDRAPLNSFISYIGSLADDYVAKGGDWKRECISMQLSSWAQEGALVDAKVTMHGEAVRMWAAGALAAAAMKVYDCKNRPPDTVVKWFNNLSDIVIEYLNLRNQKLKDRSITNITYWSGKTLGSISVITHRKDLWDRGRQIYMTALKSIGQDGTLEAELRRAGRSSIYHTFAAQALVSFAALGPLWHEDLFATEDSALFRLLRLVDTIVASPQTLKDLAGAEQLPVGAPRWFLLLPNSEPYSELRAKDGKEARFPRLGGSLTQMNKVIGSDGPNSLRQCLTTPR